MNICIFFGVIVFALLMVFMLTNCVFTERFTAPGLTLTMPPSWFPQNAAAPYRKNKWKTKMYLDRYPFHTSNGKQYMSFKQSNELASTDRLWRF
jgi:hypothetical protein